MNKNKKKKLKQVKVFFCVSGSKSPIDPAHSPIQPIMSCVLCDLCAGHEPMIRRLLAGPLAELFARWAGFCHWCLSHCGLISNHHYDPVAWMSADVDRCNCLSAVHQNGWVLRGGHIHSMAAVSVLHRSIQRKVIRAHTHIYLQVRVTTSILQELPIQTRWFI